MFCAAREGGTRDFSFEHEYFEFHEFSALRGKGLEDMGFIRGSNL